MPDFCHLHCHTQYSLLDGAAGIEGMISKAAEDQMKAVAITDHGNMFGAFHFYKEATRQNIKPILGCEFYLVKDRFEKKFENGRRDKRYHQLLLAKNEIGYHNISKLCSLGFLEGHYNKFPRIDKELLSRYKEGLIATSCCVAAEIPRTFLDKGEAEAEQVFLEWKKLFGDDFYAELQRHHIKGIDQESVNQFMIRMARKHDVKLIATNDSHYIDQEDWTAHDILLCINTGDFMSTPKGEGKGYRFGFENDQFYFKTKEEMAGLFHDVPEAIENTVELSEKIETPRLARDILLPNFTLPQGFDNEDDYLKHLTYQRAEKKYNGISTELSERLDYELKVIKDMKYAGYFLIVQDFIEAARQRNVWVGPGRGSAAGSAVAYAVGITNVDPIAYNLLFERFLNPDRISMPDVDIDFDDEGRQKVIDYVVEKYGKEKVAQIITYGKMAAKSSIRDVGRVKQYPLGETDKLAKMVADGPGISLAKTTEDNPEFKKIKSSKTDAGEVLRLAEKLEGSIRQRGIHAAGIIISPKDIIDCIPVCSAKDSDLMVTQFDKDLVEKAGMLKMDFLGLKTLSIIKDAVALVEQLHGITVDMDALPLDDEKTMKLYQDGHSVATFQFESENMRLYLQDLKPTNIEDLIAMIALYRPGPMNSIGNYINRKHGREKIVYPHPSLEHVLAPTYGILIFQEQIMETAKVIAGFSLAKADILRRAMGKKNKTEMAKMRSEFLAGAMANKIEHHTADEIFNLMERFADYGFNRSHAAAYTLLAFQTGYLKAHYPAEYMAAVLTHNMNDIKKINMLLDECHNMDIVTLGPDINESDAKFTVNKKGQIRFALTAIKGVGAAAVEEIVKQRLKGEPYSSIFNVTQRVNLRAVNKKSLEGLAMAGAFDCFGPYRSQYFHTDATDQTSIIEKAVKAGAIFQDQLVKNQGSLFGDLPMETSFNEPEMPSCAPWSKQEKLAKEKEVTGMYISGHPLDEYELELTYHCTNINQLTTFKNKEKRIGGMVVDSKRFVDKKGRPFGRFTVEDFESKIQLMLFSEDYLKFKHLLEVGTFVCIRGKYQARYKSADQFEFRISDMMLLQNVRDELTKKFELMLNLEQVDATMVGTLKTLMKKYPGKIPVGVRILDKKENNFVKLNSKSIKIELNNEFIKALRLMPGITFGLN